MFKNEKQFRNIPYKKDGRSYFGSDCYGICVLFNRDVLSIKLPEFLSEDVYIDESITQVFNDKKKSFKEVKIGKEKSGDIVSLNLKGYPVHVGVIVQKGIMLHIMESKYATVENYLSNKWTKRVNSIWRYESTI